MTALNPYISFHQNAREALEFYHSVLGGELKIDTFGSYPMGLPAEEENLVMHGQLETEDGLTLMAADTPSHMEYVAPSGAGISISISGDDEARLQHVWDGLVANGTETVPFETPPWGGRFGMLVDQFGVAWMVALNAS